MGLAFWRNYHEQQAAQRSAAESPLQALESPKNPRTAKAETKPVEAVAAPSPPPPPEPKPKEEEAPAEKVMTERERIVERARARSRAVREQPAKAS